MSAEQRGRQSLNLATGFPKANLSLPSGTQLDMLPDRWARIGHRAKDKTSVFNNLHWTSCHFHLVMTGTPENIWMFSLFRGSQGIL